MRNVAKISYSVRMCRRNKAEMLYLDGENLENFENQHIFFASENALRSEPYNRKKYMPKNIA